MVELVKEFASGIYNLLLGMVTTSKHLTRHAITLQYPKERWEIPARSRGMVVLLTDHETGKLNCTSCLLCEKACPSGAIDIDVFKDENKKRHLQEFIVDFQKCCLCGLCEESCNFAAIKMATTYEYPEWDKAKLVYDKDMLAKAGYDVPYEKPVRKKPAAKKVPPTPAPASSPSPSPEAEPKAEAKPTDTSEAPSTPSETEVPSAPSDTAASETDQSAPSSEETAKPSAETDKSAPTETDTSEDKS